MFMQEVHARCFCAVSTYPVYAGAAKAVFVGLSSSISSQNDWNARLNEWFFLLASPDRKDDEDRGNDDLEFLGKRGSPKPGGGSTTSNSTGSGNG